jgi:hypothetical protein
MDVAGARSQSASRLARTKALTVEQQQEEVSKFVQELRSLPIAIRTGALWLMLSL